jgi:signal recognition particle GTPase
MTIDKTIEYALIRAKALIRSATSAERDSLPYFIQKDMARLARQHGKRLDELKKEISCYSGGK